MNMVQALVITIQAQIHTGATIHAHTVVNGGAKNNKRKKMTKTLIAKPVVKDQYWIVTDGTEKVGNVIADGSGFEVKLNGNKTHFKTTNAIKKETDIEFQKISFSRAKVDIPFYQYPTTAKVYNSVLDVQRKLHLYTKTQKSKCYYAAGWYTINQGANPLVVFCPKYIFIQRYDYMGPFKTEDEARNAINSR